MRHRLIATKYSCAAERVVELVLCGFLNRRSELVLTNLPGTVKTQPLRGAGCSWIPFCFPPKQPLLPGPDYSPSKWLSVAARVWPVLLPGAAASGQTLG